MRSDRHILDRCGNWVFRWRWTLWRGISKQKCANAEDKSEHLLLRETDVLSDEKWNQTLKVQPLNNPEASSPTYQVEGLMHMDQPFSIQRNAPINYVHDRLHFYYFFLLPILWNSQRDKWYMISILLSKII